MLNKIKLGFYSLVYRGVSTRGCAFVRNNTWWYKFIDIFRNPFLNPDNLISRSPYKFKGLLVEIIIESGEKVLLTIFLNCLFIDTTFSIPFKENWIDWPIENSRSWGTSSPHFNMKSMTVDALGVACRFNFFIGRVFEFLIHEIVIRPAHKTSVRRKGIAFIVPTAVTQARNNSWKGMT